MTGNCHPMGGSASVREVQRRNARPVEVVQFTCVLGEGGGHGMRTPRKRVKASLMAFGE